MTTDTPDYDVIVIGAGFAGLCAAITLRDAGVDRITVLEKAHDVGGTWRENTYPGAACDVMSLMYSFSFAPNPHRTRGYAAQPEILDYLRGVADTYGLRPLIRFGADVVARDFDDDNDHWTVTLGDGSALTARIVIDATGPSYVPNLPDLPGRETFVGTAFHSSNWDHRADLAGKRIAVIGTGASAVQFIPALAEQASHLHVFRRAAAWVLPQPDRLVTATERLRYRALPGARTLVRSAIYLSNEALIGAFLRPKYMPAVRAVAAAHLRRHVRDPRLREQLAPDYQIGRKRIVIDNRYYRTLQRDNVSLQAQPITELTATGLRTADGAEHPVDVIVYCTGFKVADAWVDQHLVGSSGRTIQQLWRRGPEAHFGVATRGLPNHFTVMGPDTGVGNQSIVFMIEAQTRYIVTVIRAMFDRDATRVEVKSHVQQQFNRDLQRKSGGTVWTTGGRSSRYLDDARVNSAIWPASTVSYWRQTRHPRLADYEYTRTADRETDDDYRGPATLLDEHGTAHDVRAHLRSVYQPLDNRVHWYGRIAPSDTLQRLHTRANQPVRIRIGRRQPIHAVLVDADPWGGSRITGHGIPPFSATASLAGATTQDT